MRRYEDRQVDRVSYSTERALARAKQSQTPRTFFPGPVWRHIWANKVYAARCELHQDRESEGKREESWELTSSSTQPPLLSLASVSTRKQGTTARGGVGAGRSRPPARTARVSCSTRAHTEQREEASPRGSHACGHRLARLRRAVGGDGHRRPAPWQRLAP